MGFPISEEAQLAAGGVQCGASRGWPAPASRTHHSRANQIGNAMRVNAIGGTHLYTVLVLSNLGTLGCEPELQQQPQPASSSQMPQSERGPKGPEEPALQQPMT